MSKVPDSARPGYQHTAPLARSASPAPNPQVTVSARTDRVLYGPSGEVLIRIEDRPIGFGRPS